MGKALWESHGNGNWLQNWEWEWEGMEIDCTGIGGGGNVKSHSRASLLTRNSRDNNCRLQAQLNTSQFSISTMSHWAVGCMHAVSTTCVHGRNTACMQPALPSQNTPSMNIFIHGVFFCFSLCFHCSFSVDFCESYDSNEIIRS